MSDINPVSDNMLCAGRRGKSGCHGDSGRPLSTRVKKLVVLLCKEFSVGGVLIAR